MSDLEVHKPKFVELTASVTDLAKRFKDYQDLKEKILTDDDKVKINGKEYIKKSGRTKFEVAFNLSTKILSERKEVNPIDPSKYAYHFTVECRADNGRVIEEVGSCDNTEKQGAAEHVIRSMAKTRGTSRAVFEMIGAGDMAAEEAELIPKQEQIESHFCKCANGKRDINPIDKKCRTCGKLSELK